LVGDGEAGAAVGAGVDAGTATGTVGAGVGVAVGNGFSGAPDCSTDVVPLIAGNDRHMASSINAAAAPMVSFASSVCVPRGPKAVLDTELENSAPASALPGCNKIATTNMTDARINSP